MTLMTFDTFWLVWSSNTFRCRNCSWEVRIREYKLRTREVRQTRSNRLSQTVAKRFVGNHLYQICRKTHSIMIIILIRIKVRQRRIDILTQKFGLSNCHLVSSTNLRLQTLRLAVGDWFRLIELTDRFGTFLLRILIKNFLGLYSIQYIQ